jgi:hypothetical protein
VRTVLTGYGLAKPPPREHIDETLQVSCAQLQGVW